MTHTMFRTLSMDRLDAEARSPVEWLWHGYLARGNVTLLTSTWKTGKTTLVTGLLGRLAADGEFLGRACAAAKALVVSEESPEQWADRLRTMPLGPHARLLSRPFIRRPTPENWEALIDHARESRAAGELDLLVVDPLASFLPTRSENDAAGLLAALRPLHGLASAGASVLLLHHPRKGPADEGSAARGTGALLGFVDVILELHRFGKLASDGCRRRLHGLSRRPETPENLFFQWDPATGDFEAMADPHGRRYHDNWPVLRAILDRRPEATTAASMRDDWPPGHKRPRLQTLYEWLNRATAEGRIYREGTGRKNDPFRYRLPSEYDKVKEMLDRDWKRRSR